MGCYVKYHVNMNIMQLYFQFQNSGRTCSAEQDIQGKLQQKMYLKGCFGRDRDIPKA